MQRFLTFLWFAALAAWGLLGLLLAGGIISASQTAPWGALATQAVLWAVPPLIAWGLWRLWLRTARFCGAHGERAVRATGKAALFAVKTADKLG